MIAAVEFIFYLLLFMLGLAVALAMLFCIVEFVVIAVKKTKEEVQKDGGTE